MHRIQSKDLTPFLHTHPFAYASLILRGGYGEQTSQDIRWYGPGSLLLRRSDFAHRLARVEPGTLTLFITWKRKDNARQLRRPEIMDPDVPWVDYPAGVYQRRLYGRVRYCKFDQFWHTAADTVEAASASTKPSIDQKTKPLTSSPARPPPRP
ncbi:hypothetical protein [Cupriavidus oxalaticus]|uniref:Uncharacterized protein n=1 Tax=Cupriavidus oxalaticus TaxID=96344 RepID=A0A4V1BZT7_9BURK|nr:hypothetical protein [Cupriavidus oxalaticus]QBY56462.1 hypothetical protein E0W60_36385 [Cupriavidus oxalaticus]